MIILVVSFVLGLLCIAGFISAAETAITATSPGLIQKLKSEGNKRAELLLGILKIKEKVISTLLIGNSIANTICTTISTGIFIEYFINFYVTNFDTFIRIINICILIYAI
jgi:Mg2+/Co2+ transporter CorB